MSAELQDAGYPVQAGRQRELIVTRCVGLRDRIAHRYRRRG
jgi:hypothetical protein